MGGVHRGVSSGESNLTGPSFCSPSAALGGQAVLVVVGLVPGLWKIVLGCLGGPRRGMRFGVSWLSWPERWEGLCSSGGFASRHTIDPL